MQGSLHDYTKHFLLVPSHTCLSKMFGEIVQGSLHDGGENRQKYA